MATFPGGGHRLGSSVCCRYFFHRFPRRRKCAGHRHSGIPGAPHRDGRWTCDRSIPGTARGSTRVRDALDFEVTRSGGLYVAIVLVIGIAALNTGNNLLYIIVAAMLAAILVSGIASAVCLRGLQLELKIPEHIFANVEVYGTICVRNPENGCPRFRSARSLPKP